MRIGSDFVKIPILEFAESKKEIERSLSPKTDVIMDHLLYILLSPKSDTVNHWEHEVYAILSRIDKLKNTNKYPTQQQIYDWTYGKKRDTVMDSPNTVKVMIQAAQEEENIFGNFNVNLVMKALDFLYQNYFKWLSTELSTVGRVAPSSVKNVIEHLLDNVFHTYGELTL